MTRRQIQTEEAAEVHSAAEETAEEEEDTVSDACSNDKKRLPGFFFEASAVPVLPGKELMISC